MTKLGVFLKTNTVENYSKPTRAKNVYKDKKIIGQSKTK